MLTNAFSTDTAMLANATGLATHSVLSLHAPWPESLGRASLTAARAVRDAGFNASVVSVTVPAAERSSLLSLPGGRVVVEAEDASVFYEARAAADERVAGRRLQRAGRYNPGPALDEPLLGSMGGYFTSAELDAEMARLRANYPDWVAPPETVGTSRGGRPIKMWCVSAGGASCAGGAEPPSVLYTALVHSREPATLMCLVHALRSLLKDASARVGSAHQLLASRKLLWLPIANPDGYAWNERSRPRGGGMKRKNGAHTCNPPNTENDGVDLNRNFGYKYHYDDVGSSGRGCSEEYRGTSAFSEPETQAIRAIAQKHRPKAILHWHGWGNDIAFPFSYDWRAPMSSGDLGMYQEFAAEMAASNRYAAGRAWESVGYTTNGEADDWGWGSERAVSLTIEVGASRDGFWPKPDRILPIAQESAWPAKYLAWAAGPMLQVDGLTVAPVGDEPLAELRVTLQNNGLGSFSHDHLVCAHAAPPAANLRQSEGWVDEAAAPGDLFSVKKCVTIPKIAPRMYHTLPALTVAWEKSQKWLAITLTSQPPDATEGDKADAAAAAAALSMDESPRARRALRGGRALTDVAAGAGGGGRKLFSSIAATTAARRAAFAANEPAPASAAPVYSAAMYDKTSQGQRSVDAFRLRVLNAPSTLRGCDELCACLSADNSRFDFSHECRAAVAPGSHCKVAKPAHTGSNWASGVVDEQFHYVATGYSRGGKCTVGSTKRDTLLAVYAACDRFGAQEPLGFANSEGGRTATVSFPCTAGTSYYLFWNAEYMPGRFPFTISEACSTGSTGNCQRAHRMRHLMRLRKSKQRRQ